MLNPEAVGRVFLAPGATDLRKSIDGLSALVSAIFSLDPFSDQWFVFCNRGRDKLKILRWDHNGFWLYYRRLESSIRGEAETKRIHDSTLSPLFCILAREVDAIIAGGSA